MKAIAYLIILLAVFLLSIFQPGCKSVGYIPDNIRWEISFEDNFETRDTLKWINHHDNGVRTIWSNKELQWYQDENVKVENGVLKLVAKKERVYGKDPESEKYFDYTSGMICNAWSHSQAYGKWEIKVRFPFRKGFWPAFYLCPKQRPTLPEVDVFEYFGIEKNSISCNLHWGIDYALSNKDKSLTKPFYNSKSKTLEGEYADRWMVWSFECLPNIMVWKLDGKIVFESTEGIPTAPMYMIANVAVKDFPENNYVVDDKGISYEMEIDYVRIYRMVRQK